MQKIKSAALALPALLLAGCAAALPAENTATIETAAAAAPQTLKVYTSASLAPAAQAYAEAQGVALTLTTHTCPHEEHVCVWSYRIR